MLLAYGTRRAATARWDEACDDVVPRTKACCFGTDLGNDPSTFMSADARQLTRIEGFSHGRIKLPCRQSQDARQSGITLMPPAGPELRQPWEDRARFPPRSILCGCPTIPPPCFSRHSPSAFQMTRGRPFASPCRSTRTMRESAFAPGQNLMTLLYHTEPCLPTPTPEGIVSWRQARRRPVVSWWSSPHEPIPQWGVKPPSTMMTWPVM